MQDIGWVKFGIGRGDYNRLHFCMQMEILKMTRYFVHRARYQKVRKGSRLHIASIVGTELTKAGENQPRLYGPIRYTCLTTANIQKILI
jgi:hypothetical protein